MEQILWTLVWAGLGELAWFRRGWRQKNGIDIAWTEKEKSTQNVIDCIVWIIGLLLLTY